MPMKNPGRLLFIWTHRWEDRETDRQTETWWRRTWTDFLNTTEASSQKSLGGFVLVGDKFPRWPEGEFHQTDEKGNTELQNSLSPPNLLISVCLDWCRFPFHFKNRGLCCDSYLAAVCLNNFTLRRRWRQPGNRPLRQGRVENSIREMSRFIEDISTLNVHALCFE